MPRKNTGSTAYQCPCHNKYFLNFGSFVKHMNINNQTEYIYEDRSNKYTTGTVIRTSKRL